MPPWRQMLFIKDVFHSARYTVDHSLSGIQAKFTDCPHMVISQSGHMCYAISRLPGQFQDSESPQSNLKIAEILRLQRTKLVYSCWTAGLSYAWTAIPVHIIYGYRFMIMLLDLLLTFTLLYIYVYIPTFHCISWAELCDLIEEDSYELLHRNKILSQSSIVFFV